MALLSIPSFPTLLIISLEGPLQDEQIPCRIAGRAPVAHYRDSDQLLKYKDAIEHHLYEKECTFFSLDETITLYDLTNTCFEGECRGNSLAKHGCSKEKRTDYPLVTLALVLDSSGFPKRSRVYEGNVVHPLNAYFDL